MCMKVIQWKKLLARKKNLIIYKRDVQDVYSELKGECRCVYLENPRPIKPRWIGVIKAISGDKHKSLSVKTIPDLQNILVEETSMKGLIILFNEFESLTRNMAMSYKSLHENADIIYIASFTKYFETQGELTDFYKTFHLVNEDELRKDVNLDVINITYPVYIFICALLFILYLKAATSLAMAVVLLGAIWFAFLAFRTLIYIGGKT